MFSLDNVLDDLWPQARPAPWQKNYSKNYSMRRSFNNLPLAIAT